MKNTSIHTENVTSKENIKNKNELLINKIQEIQLHNTEIGNFNKYFESNSKHYLLYELATYVLNDNMEILSVSRNKEFILKKYLELSK